MNLRDLGHGFTPEAGNVQIVTAPPKERIVNMKDLKKYYPEMAKVYKKYNEMVDDLRKAFAEEIREIIGEPIDIPPLRNLTEEFIGNPIEMSGYIFLYADEPSAGAEKQFDTDTFENYEVVVDGVRVSECVRGKR